MGSQVKAGKVHLLEALVLHLGKINWIIELSTAEVNVQLKYIDVHSQHIPDYTFKLFPQNESTSEITAEEFCRRSREGMHHNFNSIVPLLRSNFPFHFLTFTMYTVRFYRQYLPHLLEPYKTI